MTATAITDASQRLVGLELELESAIANRRRYFQIAYGESHQLSQARPTDVKGRTAMLDEALDKYAEQSAFVMQLRTQISDLRRGLQRGATP